MVLNRSECWGVCTLCLRTLIDHARVECANHYFTYNERMSVRSCVDAVADLALDFSGEGHNGGPFCCTH